MPINRYMIAAKREKKKLTQAEAAKLAGGTWSQTAWQRIEGGQTADPRLSTLEDMARVLGCRVADLLAE